MPIYHYKCTQCSKTTEWMGKFEARPDDVKCITCGNEAIITITGGSFTFKDGKGVYAKQYGSKSEGKR